MTKQGLRRIRPTEINTDRVRMFTVERLKKVMQELIDLKRDLIRAVYLFGSFAKGTEKAKSDIDIAFVFNERFYKEDPFRALQEAELLGAEISKKIQRPVDVVILNGASLSFAYHAVREGVCIYENDLADRILYEVTLDNKYQDILPFIKELRDEKRRVLVGRD
ncbi:MAG TPA: nucleotidyltransferase domain-containing protein [Proteobacteria bacterium]|nr:nucleotidyltransferase domain-containing protein [Pseudomonadota bacterium]